MDEKWNPNLAFAKSDPKNGHFSLFWQCAWQEKCIFASFFLILLPRVFMVTIFHIIFHPLFNSLLFPLPNTQKWPENEFENELKMAQEWLLWTTLIITTSFHILTYCTISIDSAQGLTCDMLAEIAITAMGRVTWDTSKFRPWPDLDWVRVKKQDLPVWQLLVLLPTTDSAYTKYS